MNPATNDLLGHPVWLHQFAVHLNDFTSSFPDLLDAGVLQQLTADASVFRLVLTPKERHWVLERLNQSIVILESWQQGRRQNGGNAVMKSLSPLPPSDDLNHAHAAYGICTRLIQLVNSLMAHPNYIPGIGEDLGLVGQEARPTVA